MASSPLCSVRIALIQGPRGRAKDLKGGLKTGAHPTTLARPEHLTACPASPSSRGGGGKESTEGRLRAGMRASVCLLACECVCP